MTATTTPTHMQIVLLSREAMQHGDWAMAALCDKAVMGDAEALEAVAEAIAEAAAQDDGE